MNAAVILVSKYIYHVILSEAKNPMTLRVTQGDKAENVSRVEYSCNPMAVLFGHETPLVITAAGLFRICT